MKAARSRRRRADRRTNLGNIRPLLEAMERRELLATFTVTNTNDSGGGSLRQAILDANALPGPGRDSIVFSIPASTSPNLDVAVPGFDPATQTWKIQLTSPLPTITDLVLIDGFSQAHSGVPFRYPEQVTNAVQMVSLVGEPTGGTFTLTTVAPLPVGTTDPIPYNASAATVLSRLNAILGVGNVTVEGGPGPAVPFTITFTGTLARQNWPSLVATSSLTGGTLPSVDVTTTQQGGVATDDPVIITSTPSNLLAISGNDAHNRVIIDGSIAGGTGFVLDTTDSILRGLAIANFDRGVDIPNASNVGNRIQGNFIGSYVVYHVDPDTGDPLTGLAAQQLISGGNSQEGIRIAGTNSYVGGTTAQEANVITANGGAGISLLSTATGSQVYNNQVGVIGPTALGRFYIVPNDGDGLLVASSSNLIGTIGAGNVISGNVGSGVHLQGAGSTRNVLVGNYIGAPPGGGLVLGQGNTGNQGHGVWIDGGSDNRLGGSTDPQRNVISRNWQDGVRIEGASAIRNTLTNNYIGVDASGNTILGNAGSGVGIFSSQNTVGPANVITANLRGVLISGPMATGNRVTGNRIGTDQTGNIDLGNALEGVRIDAAATGNTINGNGSGSQVISGNNLGVAIIGSGTTGNVVQGNYIGVNIGGDSDDDNSIQGVLIDDASGNTIGGPSATLRNLISANHYGIEIRNPGATSNTIQGNFIGTDATGLNRLGSELDGIFIHLGASNNTIGGNATNAGNVIGFNIRDGVRIEDNSVGNAILTNSIFDNVGLGINLVSPPGNPNNLQPAPTLTSASIGASSTTIVGSLTGAPNSTYTLQFFLNSSNPAQGEQFFGVGSVPTDGAGVASFTLTFSGAAIVGQYLTATATSASGDTSMFSMPTITTLATPKFVVTNTNDTGPGSLRQAILDANATPETDTILFQIPASLSADLRAPVSGFDPVTQTWTIQVHTALPEITAPIILDGFNQAITGVRFRYPLLTDADPAIDIVSSPNTLAATVGNDARVRVIIDGSFAPGATGFVLNTSNSLLRGLAITNFSIGVSIPNYSNVGNRIQGNYIGSYMVYPVDAQSGDPLTGSASQRLIAAGNQSQGVIVRGSNTVIGGTTPQEGNVIAGNGQQGIWIPASQALPDMPGNQIYGNQIGIVGAPSGGFYFVAPNGAEGVLIESSSNAVGGPNAGNLISGNAGAGVHVRGPSATRNRIQGNYIGAPPGGVLVLGVGNTGNQKDGVWIDNASDNLIGGADDLLRNVIARNLQDGVKIKGTSAVRNQVQNNFIGLDIVGTGILGNSGSGVAIYSANNTVGPNNVIAANVRGVLVSGVSAIGNTIHGNKIGTDATGKLDLGNAFEGVRIDSGAWSNTIQGDGQGSQVISGNNIGVAIVGVTTSSNVVVGNFIGTDNSGTADLANSLEGVQIDGSPNNTIGGATASQRNLISGNHWGIVIANPTATGNVVQGNFIGTNAAGTGPLGNELDGVWILLGASYNTIGGGSASQGNRIAYNIRDGVRIEGNSVGNAILSNAIDSNGGLGIDLVGPPGNPNNLQPAPVLTALATSLTYTRIQGTQTGSPNTSYTIQFFTTSLTGPPQGQTYLGQVVVKTDASGFASFTADVPGTIASGLAVTATATDSVGNTSGFSTPITEVLGATAFSMSVFTVNQDAGTATITVVRSGGSGGYFSVNYATMGGTAQPGVDYLPVSGTLVFQTGENSQQFVVPLLNTGLPGATLSVLLGLSNPVGAASLGSPSTATLNILNANQPGIASFSTTTFVTMANSGTATVTVVRSSGGSTVSVQYATMDGTAKAGLNYLPTSGVLTFGPGETSKTFTVPILFDPSMGNQVALGLVLSSPTGGLGIGPPNPASLVIQYVSSPRVTRLQPIAGGGGINGILVSYSEALDPNRAIDPRNYGYSVRTPGRDGRLGTRDDILIGIRSYRYDPARHAVTLRLSRAVPRRTPIRVTINQVTDVASAGVGVANLQGTLLQGSRNPGLPGGVFVGDVKGKAVVVPAGPASLIRRARRVSARG